MFKSLKLSALLLSTNLVNSEILCPEISDRNELLKIVQRNILAGYQVYSLKSRESWSSIQFLRDNLEIIAEECGTDKNLNIITQGK